jgi:hypothetical protein
MSGERPASEHLITQGRGAVPQEAARLAEAAEDLCDRITRLESRNRPKPPPLPATVEELRRQRRDDPP